MSTGYSRNYQGNSHSSSGMAWPLVIIIGGLLALVLGQLGFRLPTQSGPSRSARKGRSSPGSCRRRNATDAPEASLSESTHSAWQ